MISRFRMRSLATNLLYPLTHNSLMSHEEEKGKTKQVKGKIHEAAGVLTDNKRRPLISLLTLVKKILDF
jgi:hypothetical protein